MKKLLAILLLAFMVIGPSLVSAASNSYTSYLVLPPDVQVEGDARSYDYSKYKVSFTADRVYYDNVVKIVIISLNQKKFLSSTQLNRVAKDFYLNTTNTAEMGTHSSGKMWFGFGSYQNSLKKGNSGHGLVYSGLDSDKVVMTSYN